MPGYEINVDASDALEKINKLKANMTDRQFRNAMYGVMRRTSRHVAVILKKDLPMKYEVRPAPIGKAVKSPKLVNGGLGCSIPIKDKRGDVGGFYRAAGGAHGWNSLRRKYKVTARVVKAHTSTIAPVNGYKPFRNLSTSKVAYVRTSKKRYPIEKIMRVSIPQMPLNQSEAQVQRDIKIYLEKQIDQRIRAMMMGK